MLGNFMRFQLEIGIYKAAKIDLEKALVCRDCCILKLDFRTRFLEEDY